MYIHLEVVMERLQRKRGGGEWEGRDWEGEGGWNGVVPADFSGDYISCFKF